MSKFNLLLPANNAFSNNAFNEINDVLNNTEIMLQTESQQTGSTDNEIRCLETNKRIANFLTKLRRLNFVSIDQTMTLLKNTIALNDQALNSIFNSDRCITIEESGQSLNNLYIEYINTLSLINRTVQFNVFSTFAAAQQADSIVNHSQKLGRFDEDPIELAQIVLAFCAFPKEITQQDLDVNDCLILQPQPMLKFLEHNFRRKIIKKLDNPESIEFVKIMKKHPFIVLH